MREGVDSRCRSDVRWQADGQLRSEHSDVRHELRGEENRLLLSRFQSDHAGASDFTAGARGGRDRVDWRHRINNERVAAQPIFILR